MRHYFGLRDAVRPAGVEVRAAMDCIVATWNYIDPGCAGNMLMYRETVVNRQKSNDMEVDDNSMEVEEEANKDQEISGALRSGMQFNHCNTFQIIYI